MLPKRRRPPRMLHKDETVIRRPQHLAWVRGHTCSVEGKNPDDQWVCHPTIEAAHVRTGTDGGMGKKPGDNWTIPLCSMHHMIQHRIGEERFEDLYKIDMKAIASGLWAKSPHRVKYETRHQH